VASKKPLAHERILQAGNSSRPWEPIQFRFFVAFVAFCWVFRRTNAPWNLTGENEGNEESFERLRSKAGNYMRSLDTSGAKAQEKDCAKSRPFVILGLRVSGQMV
jgi:hypothetical protein